MTRPRAGPLGMLYGAEVFVNAPDDEQLAMTDEIDGVLLVSDEGVWRLDFVARFSPGMLWGCIEAPAGN